ncbi:TrwC relaxase [Mycolicibacterium fallax]|uniref:TrwC relaxase n=2 Tax=Mycolicibacterium fallax TaxID=1793 RepID=A0A1X1RK71_MYCFA|nr:MobF family relaxase [Mycolicibacterium fallax]ORV08063.1 TrwC relaxase [Mycolicibacterium fallax]
MGNHKLTAGDGYLYLLRQIAASDATHRGRSKLADYYTAKGESPGTWLGRGLAGLSNPVGRPRVEPASYDHLLTNEQRAQKRHALDVQAAFEVPAGSIVTEEQMKALFGLGYHPNAEQLTKTLLKGKAGKAAALAAIKLGRPFQINDGETELRQRLAVALRDHNLSIGQRWNSPIEEDLRARLRTEIALELFERDYGRPPADDRELGGFIARQSREQTTSVAGYDFTFSPVKSVSVLWSLAPKTIAETIEQCHNRAVTDALDYLQDNACFTRVGTDGVAQVDTEGFIAAAFTHRDSRAGDPDLHTHVAVSNKVRTTGADGVPRWLALDGRPIYKSTVAASELYNTRLEGYMRAALGVEYADRADSSPNKRPVREIIGIPPALIEGFSSRRTAIESRVAELSKQFQIDHGREPTTTESLALAQRATLETRQAKHEPRSHAEQRQQWRTQAASILGDTRAVAAVVTAALSHTQHSPSTIDDAWIAEHADLIVATVSETRATWQRTHIYAEAQRLLRAVGATTDATLADRLTDTALRTPNSIALEVDPGGDRGEPRPLRRRDGTSVYRAHGTHTYTSNAIVAAEQRILASAQLRDGRHLSPMTVDLALLNQAANRHPLNDGQATLVREMACSGRRVQLALAPAGSGKTTAMAALARAWEESGGTVVGLSPSASAAQLLRKEIDVAVGDTVDKFNWLHSEPGADYDPAREWFDRIDENTLIIVDEAGKAGTLALDAVITAAMQRGATVRLIGDDQQLASISAGGILRDLAETSDAITLTQIMRFASRAEAAAGAALRSGDPASLGFYADHGRIHVGADDTAADMAFQAWCADREQGQDSLLLAPTNDLVADLNARARLWRLDHASTQDAPGSGPAREAQLADGLHASVGDVVVTKENSRRLRLGSTDFVRNGYLWTVTDVRPDGSLTVVHNDSRQHLHLPAAYVRANVRLGYAATIDTAQGATARHRCHTVGHDGLTRQQLYTALSRGVNENHLYLSTAETDPHRILSPKATHPETALDVLTRALARDGAQVSATTLQRTAANARAQLAANAARYTDAVGVAAEALLTPVQQAALDHRANDIYPGLTEAPAWPVLRKHLARIGANNHNPLRRLQATAERGGLSSAHDPAAVLDWRLDPTGTHSGGHGPLAWLPAIPARVAEDPAWAAYLRRRGQLITELSEQIRAETAAWTPATAPRWARPLVGLDDDLLADLAVFRAAVGVDDADTRITGPDQYSDRLRAQQRQLNDRTAALIGKPGRDTARFGALVDAINPHIRRDPYWPHLATHLATAARTGVDIGQLVESAAAEGPLPDELPAAALWWRISGTLSPATIDTPNARLRPPWIGQLHTIFGSSLAETIAADPAFPGLVTAVAAATRGQWSPTDLLEVAGEHLRDADATLTDHLRPDEYARLLTYSIDVFTADRPFDHAGPLPEAPPLTREEYEQLQALYPDPHAAEAGPIDLDDPDAMLQALDLWAGQDEPPDLDEVPAEPWIDTDSYAWHFDDLPPSPGLGARVQAAADLDDLRALRTRLAEQHLRVDDLTTRITIQGRGPAVDREMPRVLDIRARADADRPYLSAVLEVLAMWADADTDYQAALNAARDARDYVTALGENAASDDPAHLAAAETHAAWAEARVPAQAPSADFWDELNAARQAREDAAGGPDRIVTHADADEVLLRARDEDTAMLAAERYQLKKLTAAVDTAQTAVAQAFATSQLDIVDHLQRRAADMDIELRALSAAGILIPQPRLIVPDGHPAAARLGAVAFAATPIHAPDRAQLEREMAILASVATDRGRSFYWCSPQERAPERHQIALTSDELGAAVDAGTWAPEAGSILAIEAPELLEPEMLARIIETAGQAQSRVWLIDDPSTSAATWPPPPSAALIRLLHADLPWALAFPGSVAVADRRATGIDLDAALIQAGALTEPDPQTAAAVERRAHLRAIHLSAYRVDTRLQWAAQTATDRDDHHGR